MARKRYSSSNYKCIVKNIKSVIIRSILFSQWMHCISFVKIIPIFNL